MNTWSSRKFSGNIFQFTLNGRVIGDPFTTYEGGLAAAHNIVYAGHQGGEFSEADFNAMDKEASRVTSVAAQAA